MSASIDELYERIPHVEHGWARQAITELALRDVSGTDIGAAILEVESHMAEHGGDVGEVFGDPKAYAAALELPDTEKLSRSAWAGAWLPSILIFLGGSVLFNGMAGLFGGAGLSVISLGIVLLVLIMAGVAIVKSNLLRFMVERPIVSGLGLFVLIGGLGALAVFLPGPTLDLTPAVSLPAGAILLVSGILLIRRLRRHADANGITFPSA